MKSIRFLLLSLLFSFSASSWADNFNVSAPTGFNYTINGVDGSPTINVTRGTTNTFFVDASGHPFQILDRQGAEYNIGVQNNNTEHGAITFVVPTMGPSQLMYTCSAHGGFFTGTLNIVG